MTDVSFNNKLVNTSYERHLFIMKYDESWELHNDKECFKTLVNIK